MFNRYFRSYPWWLQFVLFLLMAFTMLSFSSVIAQLLIPKMTGVQLLQIKDLNENSPKNLINATIIFQLITSVGIFLLPTLLFSYLAHPRPTEYLGLRAPGRPIHWLLVITLFLGAMPVFLVIENLISQINFGANIKAMQQANENIMNAFLKMSSPADLIKTFFVMALIPAVGEELFFRGVLLRFAKKKTHTMVFPIIFSALVFAFAHANIYGFLSIFLAGVLLAVIYYNTGSIYCSMLGHFLNNGLQIALVYMSRSNAAIKHVMDSNALPVYLPIAGIVVFTVSLYMLIKNRTPLPPDWANDYRLEELTQKQP